MTSVRYLFIDPAKRAEYERLGWESAGLVLGGSVGLVWAGEGDPVVPLQHAQAVKRPNWRRRMHTIRRQEREAQQ